MVGGKADLLYFADNGTLQIGQWGLPEDSEAEINKDNYRTKLAFFKFGSVVGFDVNGAWDAAKVHFDPVVAAHDYSNYANVPSFTAADYNGHWGPSVSHASYHTLANLKAGRGDPCKLVGLTIEEIKGATSLEALEALQASRETDVASPDGPSPASGWRLPRATENAYFVDGRTNWAPGDADYTINPSNYAGCWTANGRTPEYPPTASFPIVDTPELLKFSQILPVAGAWSGGVISYIGVYGHFYSSNPASSTNGYRLRLYSTAIIPTFNNQPFNYGINIRCVRP